MKRRQEYIFVHTASCAKSLFAQASKGAFMQKPEHFSSPFMYMLQGFHIHSTGNLVKHEFKTATYLLKCVYNWARVYQRKNWK
jgi:hypothetical protein